ncbi:serine hydrolase-like protein isoform X2 [Oncorhynchus kisutch]|uniref:serine hydrolase-like protein isoform X2 n=1 Tax=Oncorhynchus kisutch TaxID=8019 RepID=UPI0012DED739|nr:serine hydrolase-like protein isoform X2 [Oncorhynchus kisutch]
MQTLKGVRHLMTSATMKQAVTEFNMPVPWGEIRGKVWGPDHGRPILCLHGWADNCGTFNTLIPLLPKEWKCVAVDMAGHGLSSHRPPGVFYSFPAYVADIRRVIGALQWKRFSIIGHSMGGNVAGMKELHTVIRQGFEGMLEFEKKKDEKKEKVYTYENALMRLLAANPTLSEQSAHILLERGLAQVEGGVVFTRDFRINLKNVVRVSLEQSLELQSRIQARVLVVLAEEGFEKMFSEPQQKTFTSTLLLGYKDQSGMVVNVPGDHHVHLNTPETVAQLVTDFLQKEAPSHSTAEDTQAAKL